MLPNIYAILRANSTVSSTVSTRIYRHGSAPQDVVKPYITWFVVFGMPELQISGTPDSDMDTIQVDIWSDTDEGVETLAYAARAAFDNAGHAARIVQDLREADTRIYRICLEVDIIQSR
jgi:hypothetical protein